MIKVIFVENSEIRMSKEEFEKLLEETYNRGKDENYEAAYNKGFKDGYCGQWWSSGIRYFGNHIEPYADNDNTVTTPNTWRDYITYCNDISGSNSCKGE